MAKSPVQKGIHQDDSLQVSVVSDDDSDDSWKQKRIQSVLHQVDAPQKSDSHHRSSDSSSGSDSSDGEVTSAGRFRSVVGTTVKRPDYRSDGESSDDDRGKRDKAKARRQARSQNDRVKKRRQSRSRSPVYRGRQGRTSRSRSRSSGDKDRNSKRSRSRSRSPNYRDRRGRRDYGRNESHRDRRRDYDRQEEKWNRRKRIHDDDKENKRNEREGDKKSTDEAPAEPKEKKKKPEPDILTTRTGGAYIPPAKLRLMQQQITDKTSTAYQRIAWEALKKSINGLINKVNVSNIALIVTELFAENIIRGRGMLARSIIQAQSASPTFTHVYASLVAIINSKLPQNGELILKRLIVNFQKSFKRNDKSLCLSATRFIAHLVNQQVAHEVLALEILTLLLENPSDDSVEVAVGFLKECGQKLYDISPRGMHAIFDRLRSILHESQIDKRVQYMVEVMFAVRKDGFKDFPTIVEGLDLVDEAEQFTHLLTLEEQYTTEDILNVFKHDQEYLENEERYKQIKIGLLGGDSDSDSDGSEEGSSSEAESDTEAAKMEILDRTETNLVALRRTIYLTIQSSAVFEECAHKLLKMEIKPGQEKEVCLMILDCCAQQRTYEKFYGLLAQRFCQLKKEYLENFTIIFGEQYDICHRLETNKLRNVAKFFAHLLYTDAIPWTALSCIRLNEDDTTSSSRIFIKILFQELSEYMGLPKLNERFKDQTLQPFLEGLMPHDNPANTRFSINFFTTIGLGGLTDDLREHLKLQQKKIMEQRQPLMKSDSSDSSDSSSDESSSSDDESSSSSSTSSTSSESEDERRKRKKKKQTNEKKKNKGKSKQIREKKKRKKKPVSSSSSSSSSASSSSSSSSSSGIASNSSTDSDSSDAESAQEISRSDRKKRRQVDERNYGQLGNGREENDRSNQIYRRGKEDRINRGRDDRDHMRRDERVGRGRDEDSRWRGEGDHRWRDEGEKSWRNEEENRRRDERDNRMREESGYRGREERHSQGRAERDSRGRDNQGRDNERDNRGRNNRQNRENYNNRERESSESPKIRRVNHKNRGRENSESPGVRRRERYINRGRERSESPDMRRESHKNRGREVSKSPEVRRRERYINKGRERSESPEIRRENHKNRGRERSESPEIRRENHKNRGRERSESPEIRRENHKNRGRVGSESPEIRRENRKNRGSDRSESREIRRERYITRGREGSESPDVRRINFNNKGRESPESPDIKKKYIYNNKWKESSESPEVRRRNHDEDRERLKGTPDKRDRIEERNSRHRYEERNRRY